MRVHSSHPQLRKEITVEHAYVFDCSGCGEVFYVRGAHVQADGSLRCRNCSESRLTPNGSHRVPVDYYWCPRCREAKVYKDFGRDRFDRREGRCLECGAATRDRTTTCERCGTEFTPTRRDARFCSGRCRVAAHRAPRSV